MATLNKGLLVVSCAVPQPFAHALAIICLRLELTPIVAMPMSSMCCMPQALLVAVQSRAYSYMAQHPHAVIILVHVGSSLIHIVLRLGEFYNDP